MPTVLRDKFPQILQEYVGIAPGIIPRGVTGEGLGLGAGAATDEAAKGGRVLGAKMVAN